MLVDEGPPEADVAGQLRRLGVRGSPLLVLTHPQRDHVGGAAEVVRKLGVGDRPRPGGCRCREPGGAAALREAAQARSVPVVVARAGRDFTLGRLRVRVLWPDGRCPPAEDPNDHATVLLASYGERRRAADRRRGVDVTSRLAPAAGRDPQGRATTAPPTTASPRCSSSLRPRIAVISVGADNDYGHPTPRRSRRSRRGAGLAVYRTDRRRTRRRRVRRRAHRGPDRALTMLAHGVRRAAAARLSAHRQRPAEDRARARAASARASATSRSRSSRRTRRAATTPSAPATRSACSRERRRSPRHRRGGRALAQGRRRGGRRVPRRAGSRARARARRGGSAEGLGARKACAKHGEVLVYDVPQAAQSSGVGARAVRAPRRESRRRGCRALVEIVRRGRRSRSRPRSTRSPPGPGASRSTGATSSSSPSPRPRGGRLGAHRCLGRAGSAASLLAACELALERTEPFLAARSALAAHVARVRACQALAAEGLRAREIAAPLKMHEFPARKALAARGELLARRARRSASSASPSSTPRSRAASRLSRSSSWSGRSSTITRPARATAGQRRARR